VAAITNLIGPADPSGSTPQPRPYSISPSKRQPQRTANIALHFFKSSEGIRATGESQTLRIACDSTVPVSEASYGGPRMMGPAVILYTEDSRHGEISLRPVDGGSFQHNVTMTLLSLPRRRTARSARMEIEYRYLLPALPGPYCKSAERPKATSYG
jgi:hypothetical protein